MKSFDEMEHHALSEKLVAICTQRISPDNPVFFRVVVAYYFAVMASMMRCRIHTLDRGEIIINAYAIALAVSGFGKGRSVNFMEGEILNQFMTEFKDITFPLLASINLPILANDRAVRKGGDPDIELALAEAEFTRQGPFIHSFDAATPAAIKQVRHKLLMANGGAMNLQIDEIGSNLLGNMEAFNKYLELYDVGKIKPSLTKNTAENARSEEIEGKTPANMLLFGAPNKLYDGGKVEAEFHSMLDTGYARRSLFAFVRKTGIKEALTPAEILAQRICTTTGVDIQAIADQLGQLADLSNNNKILSVSEAVTLLFIEYEIMCSQRAEKFSEHEDLQKNEVAHRHFKALKIAGAYAFVDGSPEILEEHAYAAIKLVEESGASYAEMLTRDRPYIKLAKYIADVNRNVSLHDMVVDLPFFKGSAAQKDEMLQLAIAYGYQNSLVIKKSYVDSVAFYRGEALKETDLDALRVSYGKDIAVDYKNDIAQWDNLHRLVELDGYHWTNHHLKDGHRKEENAIPGFNMIVVDVDGGTNLRLAKKLLEDYKALYYTTKRHTSEENRYRIIFPLNFELKMDAKDFRAFMQNFYDWLPFPVDTATGQRARKWLSCKGHHEYTDGESIDALPFIPNTSKCEERRKILESQQSMDNLERWFINNTGDGNRNNQLLRYGMVLVDAGLDYKDVQLRIMELNSKLIDSLAESEILSTIMTTVSKAWGNKHQAPTEAEDQVE